MKDDKTKYRFTTAANKELTFMKEDRDEVFRKIRQAENKKVQTAALSLFTVSKKLAPLTISLLMIGLSLFLFFPSLFQSTGNETTGTAPIGEVAQQEEDEEFFTALFSIKDEEDRIPLNLLLAYNQKKKRMNIVSIMRDTYTEMPNPNDPDTYKKLSHAYLNGSKGAESVKAAVSDLFDLPIDYYAVMDLGTFSAAVDSVDGIIYDLPEDVTVRAISQVAFDFKKGSQKFNGEEVVALLMDAAEGKSLDEEEQLNLIDAVTDQTINVLTDVQLKQFTEKIEGNIPPGQLPGSGLEQISIQTLSLSDGMKNAMIDEIFYIEFDKEFLHKVSEELTTFD